MLVFNVDHLKMMTQLKSVSRLKPSEYKLLISLEGGNKAFDRKDLEEYRFYYEKVVQLLPGRSDAWAMLGFCYYYLGEKDKAIEAYQKAGELNPQVFWFHYNLGVIYFKQQRYAEAAAALEAAVRAKLSDGLKFLYASIVYVPIANDVVNSEEASDKDISERFKKEYENCYALLVLSYAHLNNYAMTYTHANKAASTKTRYAALFYYHMGWAAYHLKQFKQAALFLGESVRHNPEHRDTYHYLALTMIELNQPEVAENLKKAEHLKKENNHVLFDGDTLELRMF